MNSSFRETQAILDHHRPKEIPHVSLMVLTLMFLTVIYFAVKIYLRYTGYRRLEKENIPENESCSAANDSS